MNFRNLFRRGGSDEQPQPQTDTVAEKPPMIISPDMNITIVLDGQARSVAANHPNHNLVLEAIREERWGDLENLVEIPKAIQTYSEGNVTVNENGDVFFGGEQVHSTIAERITMFFQQGLDFRPLVAFMENLMANPSRRAVEELYGFLENEGMALTDDGCFVGYKGVNADFTDRHSGQFDNSPGTVLEMARNLVDDDARRSCSNGFHVGSQRYAASWATSSGRLLLVKVNPADAVSVPYDGAEKLRVCRYEVIREVERTDILQAPLFAADPLSQAEAEAAEEEDPFDNWLDEDEEEDLYDDYEDDDTPF
ncbi:MAG: hypothetical protein K5880_14755 [Hydrogenophaga sp.]|uniref:hypothetical protein n=1 Tax=Hydrogenophaga sp. TaxID=1904254 RepID=UPI0026104AAD|nr:hypothetical protein [Hydrogenophaga sp.]MCV0439857.1 hypothetical protein [Hydrogenophaga sp.]